MLPTDNISSTETAVPPSALYATLSISQTLARVSVDANIGLSKNEFVSRQKQYGPNELHLKDVDPLWKKFLEQFKNPMIMLLLGSAAISLAMGQLDDAISITLAITIVITVAFVQEYQSEQSLEALNQLVPHYCRVLRLSESQQNTILATDLVPGDIILFSTGDRIPADLRILTSVDVEIDESSLTGEPDPCKKQTHELENVLPQDLSIADRSNIALMGTLVKHGHGTGVVVAIS
ncbi:High affinity Ca2+/Mn2+ P-type ATPase-like protein, partial [Nowakowskiella sp. JEL0078]